MAGVSESAGFSAVVATGISKTPSVIFARDLELAFTFFKFGLTRCQKKKRPEQNDIPTLKSATG